MKSEAISFSEKYEKSVLQHNALNTKKIILLCLVVLISSCKSTKGVVTTKPTDKPNYEVLALSEVSTLQKNRTYELGKRVLMTCNTSAFKPFTSQEATNEVITNINKEIDKNSNSLKLSQKIEYTKNNAVREFEKDMKQGLNTFSNELEREIKRKIRGFS